MNELADAVNEGFEESTWRMKQLRSILQEMKTEVTFTHRVLRLMLENPDYGDRNLGIPSPFIVPDSGSSDLETITTQWKNPFIIGDQEETNAIIGSRVFDIEVVVPDNVDFSSITSKDDAVNAQNTKKQKTMTDYLKCK